MKYFCHGILHSNNFGKLKRMLDAILRMFPFLHTLLSYQRKSCSKKEQSYSRSSSCSVKHHDKNSSVIQQWQPFQQLSVNFSPTFHQQLNFLFKHHRGTRRKLNNHPITRRPLIIYLFFFNVFFSYRCIIRIKLFETFSVVLSFSSDPHVVRVSRSHIFL